MKKNIYQEITDKIIAQLDKGEIMWQKPWIGDFACKSGSTGRPYSLLNQMLLGARPGYYYTFRQVNEHGGRVKKGSKAVSIYFYKTLGVEAREIGATVDETSSVVLKKIPYLKEIKVFHQDDISGIEPPKDSVSETVAHDFDINAEIVITNYVEREKINFIVKKCDTAFYRPAADMVVLPSPGLFTDIAEYYSTAFHELSHSTMAESRCDRKSANTVRRGSADYSREELVAEISAAILCHRTGVDTQKAFLNSVAYIQGWRRMLSDDPAAIVWAAARAEKAARYILDET